MNWVRVDEPCRCERLPRDGFTIAASGLTEDVRERVAGWLEAEGVEAGRVMACRIGEGIVALEVSAVDDFGRTVAHGDHVSTWLSERHVKTLPPVMPRAQP